MMMFMLKKLLFFALFVLGYSLIGNFVQCWSAYIFFRIIFQLKQIDNCLLRQFE